jgi:hypothetical protein
MVDRVLPSSFRDPSGFLFEQEGVLYRQVNRLFAADYERLMRSGLYDALIAHDLLIPHREHPPPPDNPNAYRLLEPERVPFVSYPYEWCFSQLRDAALATLAIQGHALRHGMTLRDASAFNIQFVRGRPVLIDTLSFASYEEGRPWVAYRQFCQHFLAPLALASYCDGRLARLSRMFIDGIPLELASRLLPWQTRLRLGLTSHIHLHARIEQKMRTRTVAARTHRRLSRRALEGILASLEATVCKLGWRPDGTGWRDYYERTNYAPEALVHKTHLVDEFIGKVRPRTVWDLGANVGRFSRLASERGILTVAMDADPASLECAYRAVREAGDANLLPLAMDLTNPSGGIGWACNERMSLAERGPADLVLTLALVHHLAIGNNLPLGRIAQYLAALGRALAIEWVPKTDSQVQHLLASRDDVFPEYTQASFERAFAARFAIERAEPIHASGRILYLMRRMERT